MPNDVREAASVRGSTPARRGLWVRRRPPKQGSVRTVAPMIHPEILIALTKRYGERQPNVFLTQTSVSGFPGHIRYTCVSQYIDRRWISRWPAPFTCAGSIPGKNLLNRCNVGGARGGAATGCLYVYPYHIGRARAKGILFISGIKSPTTFWHHCFRHLLRQRRKSPLCDIAAE